MSLGHTWLQRMGVLVSAHAVGGGGPGKATEQGQRGGEKRLTQLPILQG